MHATGLQHEDLRRNLLFSSLDERQLDRVLQTAHRMTLDEGQLLFERGQQARSFYLLLSGAVRLYLSAPDGSEKVLHLVSPGQVFAEAIMFMDDQRYPVNASALRLSEVVALSSRTFRSILVESTDTCFHLMSDMCCWLKRQLDDIDALTLQNATLRLTNYLLQEAPPGHMHDVSIELPAPKHVIASRLSIQPESLSRILRTMQQAGHISVNGNTIHIPDIARLAMQDSVKY